ncbi:hypothetical protein XU18_2783 [Perkinsela sp. CCAP 1560/4]|nr:hypothetical protein XU18_2783 [Perkinsela sp. CCAP 1560/4]|eukprot:KNH06278.1 hypothetical protein XU18_2783 [Perkinsela sp. CCAP 1560/4]
MTHIRVCNLPPFADNVCLRVLLGERAAFLSKVRWGKHDVDGVPYAYADVTCPDETTEEVASAFKGADVLGNKLSVELPIKGNKESHHRNKRPVDNKQVQLTHTPSAAVSTVEKTQKEGKRQERPAEKVHVEIPRKKFVSSEPLSKDACKHCGSTDHFSRKCPSKNSST